MINLTKGVDMLHFGSAGSTLISTMIAQNKLFYYDGEVYKIIRTGTLQVTKKKS